MVTFRRISARSVRRFGGVFVLLSLASSHPLAQQVTPRAPTNVRIVKGVLNGTISHGSQLTTSMVGPASLGVAVTALRSTRTGGSNIGTGGSMPSWIPNAPYVYNNDPSNHGGIVPAGGLTIDGFSVPAGAWVSQFNDFGNDSLFIVGNNGGSTASFPGIVFRGCRWRGPAKAPGYLNTRSGSHTNIWVLFSDAGGLGPADSQYNEVPFSIGDDTSTAIFYRNYISYTTTALQPNVRSAQIIENFIEKITLYYNGAAPPGESTGKHLNGISFNGGTPAALVVRNKILLQSPDDAGRTINQTDAISFFQDFGSFPGTGSNLDASIGYQVKDNYLGGGGYTVYAGMNAGKPSSSVQNMVLTGNVITTQWWPRGGSFGPIAAEPAWGSFGNLKSNNTFTPSGQSW